MSAVDDVIELLEQKRRSLRASEAGRALETLRFRVRDGSKGGHKVVSHPELKDFHGASFNAGHGSNDELRPGYVSNLIRVLKQHKEELEKLLGSSP